MNSDATCLIQPSGRQICQCPPGYVRDYTSLHNDNCSMPENFLLIWFVLSSLAYVMAILAIFWRLPNLRPRLKYLAWYYVFALLFQWMGTVPIYVENGTYEAALFFNWLWAEFLVFASVDISLAATAPVFATLGKPFESWRRFVYGCVILISLSYLGATLAVMVFARSPPEVYNVAYVVYVSYVIIVVISIAILLLGKLFKLKKLVKGVIASQQQSGRNVDDYQRVINQLDSIILASFGFTLAATPGALVTVIVASILGSFPMAYILLPIVSCSLWPNIPGILKFLSEDNKQHQVTVAVDFQQSKSKSNGHSNE
jgi:hypothetical protein